MKTTENLKQFIIKNWSKEESDQIPASDFNIRIRDVKEIDRTVSGEVYYVQRMCKASISISGLFKNSGESTLVALVKDYFQEFGHSSDKYTISIAEELNDQNKVLGVVLLEVCESVEGTRIDDQSLENIDPQEKIFWSGEYYREELLFPPVEERKHAEDVEKQAFFQNS